MSKIRHLVFLIIISSLLLSACGADNQPDENVNTEINQEDEDKNDDVVTPIVESDEVEVDETDETEIEEDLSGLTFVEVKPILDLLDDVWGKNWLDWTPEDFIEEFDVVMPTEENDWFSPPGVGVKHAIIQSDDIFTINEDGICENIYSAKDIGTYDSPTTLRRRYNRILRFPGEMIGDSMTAYFATCEGCMSNDCTKCRNIDCAGCENDRCEDEEVRECDDCLIKDCTDLLNYCGISEPCEIATEYGKANLSIDEYEDSLYVKLYDFSKYSDLEIYFTDGYGGASFSKFFISISVDDVNYKNKHSDETINDGSSTETNNQN